MTKPHKPKRSECGPCGGQEWHVFVDPDTGLVTLVCSFCAARPFAPLAAAPSSLGDARGARLRIQPPSLLIAWLELLAEQGPSSAINWQMVGRDALEIVRPALAGARGESGGSEEGT